MARAARPALRRLPWPMLAGVVLVLSGLIAAVRADLPRLIRIGAGYTAKVVCSNVFLAGRDPLDVLRTDVQAPGNPMLKLMRIDVDRDRGTVRAGLFGFLGGGLAVARPGVGCAVLPDHRLPESGRPGTPLPTRSAAAAPAQVPVLEPAVGEAIADDGLTGPGMRAIVVLRRGRVVAERYAAGFDENTPELGWSMTKSVTAGLIGLLVKDGRLSLDQSAGLEGGGRERVTIAELMSMTSGLRFNESYGDVSDVTRMLYLEPDMAAFAASEPLDHPGGAVWSYSSGSAVLLARIVQRTVGADSVNFVRGRLFEPLGMTSAVIETDESGTLVGSSYMYATPRDWARYGQLLVQDGLWEGREILPRGYVAMMSSPVAAANGEYGHGMVWRWVSRDAGSRLPGDIFWMTGHDGQFVAIIPSRQVVVVRMGLTPAREHYQPEPLVRAVLAALR